MSLEGGSNAYIPGTRRIHRSLYDNVSWYRNWHQSPWRIPVHLLVTALAIFGTLSLYTALNTSDSQAAVGINDQFPFQGRLTNPNGTVVADGTYDIVFKLYKVASGGSAVWTENHTGANNVTVTDGVFDVNLGSLTTLGGLDFNDDSFYLGIDVEGDGEMSPRIRLGAAPYAFNSDQVDGFDGTDFLVLNGQAGGQIAYGGTAASENLVLRSTTDGTKGNVALADDGGTVTVGTASPAGSATLSVSGTADISGELALGSGASIGSFSVPTLINIDHTYTGLLGMGIRNTVNFNPAAASGNRAFGSYEEVLTTTANSNDFTFIDGSSVFVVHRGSGSVSNLTGSKTELRNTGGGAITRMEANLLIASNSSGTTSQLYGLRTIASNSGTTSTLAGIHTYASKSAGTVTNANGVLISNTSSGGTATNAYGLRVEDYSSFGTTNSFNIYSEGTSSTNAFQGSVAVGTISTADRKLEVLDASNPQLRLTQSDAVDYTDFQVDGNGDLTVTASGDEIVLADTTYINTGTLTSGAQIPLDIATTWNAGGASFTGIKLNATKTAGFNSSKLIDLQLNSTSVFDINAYGVLSLDTPTNLDGTNNVGVDLQQDWGSFATHTGIKLDVNPVSSQATSKLIDLQQSSSSVFNVERYGKINQIATLSTGRSEGLNLAQTWNGTGVTMTGIKLDVTNTNSATDSKLIDLQVGSSSKFTVDRLGNTVLGNAALVTTATDGFLNITGMPGTPTGTPTAYTGRYPITWDSAGNTLYVYDAGWNAITGGGGGISGSGAAGQATFWTGATAVAGDNAFWWDNVSKELGIGTTSPDRSLEVLHATNPQLRLTQSDSVDYADFQVNGAGDLTVTPSGGDLSVVANQSAGGHIIPSLDDNYDLGSSLLRWRDLYLGPTSLHIKSTALETTTARDWKFNIIETAGVTQGNFRLLEGSSTYLAVDTSGNVGIGTPNPAQRLEVRDSSGSQLRISQSGGGGFADFQVDSAGALTFAPNGSKISFSPVTATTLTASTFDFNTTWSNGVGQHTGIDLDVTLVNSLSTSRLIDLKVNGTSKFHVTRQGTVLIDTDILPASTNENALEVRTGWNNGVGQFDAFQVNVTDTASLPGSRLLELTRDGTSYFRVMKDGKTGINTNANPGKMLEVKDSAAAQLRLTNSSGIVTDFETDSNGDLTISPLTGRKIGINSAPSATLDITPFSISGSSGLTNGFLQVNSGTYTDNVTAASGTAPSFAFGGFQRPTLAAANSAVTTTNAATLYIANAPLAGTNMTITNPYALWVDTGNVRFDGSVASNLIPASDDTYDLGSSSFRWRDLYLGPASLHLECKAAECGTAKDWRISIQETVGATRGNLRFTLGGSELLTLDDDGDLGIGVLDPTEDLEIAGAVKIGNAAGTADGTLRYTGTDFEGRISGAWTSLTAGGGGGITGSGAAGRVTYWTGASTVSNDAGFLWDATNDRLSLGATPATSGYIALPNTAGILWRNSTNTADIGLGLNANNQLEYGTGSFVYTNNGDTDVSFKNNWGGFVDNFAVEGALKVYNSDEFTGNPATSGAIRIPNNQSINWRNAANTADAAGWWLNGSDNWQIGQDSSGFADLVIGHTSNATFRLFHENPALNAGLMVEGPLEVHNAASFGTVASTGALRVSNGQAVGWRNAGNTADMYLYLNSSDEWNFSPNSSNNVDLVGGNPTHITYRILHENTALRADLDVEGSLSVYDETQFAVETVASAGAIRLGNAKSVTWRNAGDTDNQYLYLNTSDQWNFSPNASGNVDLVGGYPTHITYRILHENSALRADLDVEGALSVYDDTQFATTNVAQSGAIRVANAAWLTARNAANSADVNVIRVNSSDAIELGANIGQTLSPSTDDLYDLGTSSFRWRDLYLGPTSLHVVSKTFETGAGNARDWKLHIEESIGATQGDLRIVEGSTNHLSISTAGSVFVGDSALLTNATDGFLYIPSTNGTPTGIPTGEYGGLVPLTYDTANNKFYAYDSGWQQVGGDLTGSGSAGQITFFTGTTSTSSDTNLFWDNTNKRLGIGDTSPVSALTVGSGDRFQVDSSGNIVKINNVTYSWPASQGSAGETLINNGSGGLSWGPAGISDPDEAVRLMRGTISSTCTVSRGIGFSSSGAGGPAGCSVTFSTPFASTPSVTLTSENGVAAGDGNIANITSTTTTGFTYNVWNTATGIFGSSAVSFIAVGP